MEGRNFTITIVHDGDDDVHEALTDWVDVQALADHLTQELGVEFEFELRIAQEGPGLEAETAAE